MSDFEVVCRLRSLDGATTLIQLHDHAAGYDILGPIEVSGEAWSRQTTSSLYVDGEFPTAERLAGGTVSVAVLIQGATWPIVEARRLAIRAAYIALPTFLLDVTLEGVTQTFRANRPDVSSLAVAPSDLHLKERALTLSFPVQPNAVTTGV